MSLNAFVLANSGRDLIIISVTFSHCSAAHNSSSKFDCNVIRKLK